MKRFTFLFLFALIGCHSAKTIMYDRQYSPTYQVKVVGDTASLPYRYIVIGQVQAHGGATVDNQTLLDDMKEQAQMAGADVLFAPQFGSHTQVISTYLTGTTSVQKPDASAIMIRFVRDSNGNPIRK